MVYLWAMGVVAAQIARCIADSESYHEVVFDVLPATSYGRYHSIEVKVAPPGRVVRTRTVYYGEQ
jgi:hypothetical protein